MDEVAAKKYLMENDDRFKTLVEAHQSYEQRLEDYVRRPFLTSEEQVEETILKKKKLALKDQMQALIHQHQDRETAPSG